MTECLKIQV